MEYKKLEYGILFEQIFLKNVRFSLKIGHFFPFFDDFWPQFCLLMKNVGNFN